MSLSTREKVVFADTPQQLLDMIER
jgi:hypothetical protein